ncbi:hypothetical protein K3495_g14131 [Podosphaera aphanis]|nr:hypothetical protein K3495_g14131 [Podosphaera aphanis]
MVVRASGWYENGSPTEVRNRVSHVGVDQVAIVSRSEFANLLQQRQNTDDDSLGAISIQDITKALEKKRVASRDEVESGLPEEIRQFTDLFLDDSIREEEVLPPHRLGVDTRVKLLKDEQGRDKEVPWGPLYNMTR